MTAGLATLVLALSACSSDTDPEKGDSLYKPENDVTITRHGTEKAASGTVFAADYRIRNDGPDPLTYTVVFEFQDKSDTGVREVVKKRVEDHDTYRGTVSTPWRERKGARGVKVVDVTIR
ncbi:hypothetical protein [Streptomyces cucumeris]|uniref:hypothetical protein n=1 Tax=Streptomyces cucumeris TaxID=2962890 RepID=UPI003D71F217